MPLIWHHLFKQHVFTSIWIVTTLEGLGLPVPAELLFLATAVLIAQGSVSMGAVIMAAVGGNVVGSLLAFSLAYAGGKPLLARVTGLVGIKPQATQRMEAFFLRYGPLTVFLSRFVGVIRAATIYSAGAARMSPLRFTLYLVSAALIWNAGWQVLAYHFGRRMPDLVHKGVAHLAVWAIAMLVALLVVRSVLRWYRGRGAH